MCEMNVLPGGRRSRLTEISLQINRLAKVERVKYSKFVPSYCQSIKRLNPHLRVLELLRRQSAGGGDLIWKERGSDG